MPAGAPNNLINTGEKPLKLCTLYGPPNHTDQLVQETKAEARASTEKFKDATTE